MTSNTGKIRHHIIMYFIAVLIFVLSVCSCNLKYPESEPATQSTPNTYEELLSLTNSYFRAFYDENQSYTTECTTIDTISAANGNLLTIYYDNGALVYADFVAFGDLSTTFRKYYFLNHEIVYITKCVSDVNHDKGGNFEEYYLMSGQLNSLSHLNGTIEQATDVDEKELFDTISDVVHLDTKPLAAYENVLGYGRLYASYSDEVHQYFIRNFINNQEMNRNVSMQIGDITLQDDFFSYNCTALFRNDQLLKFALLDSTGKRNIRYDCYVVSDTIDYVVITNSEYSSTSKYADECVKTQYSEYFIVDGRTMEYDSEKQDLIEVSDIYEIITNFNIAKEKIKNSEQETKSIYEVK